MKGRFVRLASAQASSVIRVRKNVVKTPVSYDVDDAGEIFKVTGVAGFTIYSSQKDWTVKTNTEITYIANGDTSLLPTT